MDGTVADPSGENVVVDTARRHLLTSSLNGVTQAGLTLGCPYSPGSYWVVDANW